MIHIKKVKNNCCLSHYIRNEWNLFEIVCNKTIQKELNHN